MKRISAYAFFMCIYELWVLPTLPKVGYKEVGKRMFKTINLIIDIMNNMKKIIITGIALIASLSLYSQKYVSTSQVQQYEIGDTVWFMSQNKPEFGIIKMILDLSYDKYFFETEMLTPQNDVEHNYVYMFVTNNNEMHTLGEVTKHGLYKKLDFGLSDVYPSKKLLIESLYKND